MDLDSIRIGNDYRVTNLPGISQDAQQELVQYAGIPRLKTAADCLIELCMPGHVRVDDLYDANLFFWLVQRNISTLHPQKDAYTLHTCWIALKSGNRLIIWFNGGILAQNVSYQVQFSHSSMDGMLMEVGPFRVHANGTLLYRKAQFFQGASYLFLDQPPGTGLGYVQDQRGLAKSLEDVVKSFHIFLAKFMALFPEMQRHEIYLAGESYAGQYIPHIAHSMLQQKLQNHTVAHDLRAIAIGNGWIEPFSMYRSYQEYALKYKLVSDQNKPELQTLHESCDAAIRLNNSMSDITSTCSAVEERIQHGGVFSKCLNVYYVREADEQCGLGWPPDVAPVQAYLRRTDVLVAIHAQQKTDPYQECSPRVSSALNSYDVRGTIQLFPTILEQIPVHLFYIRRGMGRCDLFIHGGMCWPDSGELDFLCNYLGGERMIAGLSWAGVQGFQHTLKNASRVEWRLNGTNVGHYISQRNLTYYFVKDGSHMTGWESQLQVSDIFARMTQQPLNLNLTTSESPLPGSPNGVPALSSGWIFLFIIALLCLGGFVGWKFWDQIRDAATRIQAIGGYTYTSTADIELAEIVMEDPDEDAHQSGGKSPTAASMLKRSASNVFQHM